jgi:hypothetical protein
MSLLGIIEIVLLRCGLFQLLLPTLYLVNLALFDSCLGFEDFIA